MRGFELNLDERAQSFADITLFLCWLCWFLCCIFSYLLLEEAGKLHVDAFIILNQNWIIQEDRKHNKWWSGYYNAS